MYRTKRTRYVQLVPICVTLALACFSEQPRLVQSNTVWEPLLINNLFILSGSCSWKGCETSHIQERKNVWASGINLKKIQGCKPCLFCSLPPGLQHTHSAAVSGTCGGPACRQQCSAGSQICSSPAGTSALRAQRESCISVLWKMPGWVPCLLGGIRAKHQH